MIKLLPIIISPGRPRVLNGEETFKHSITIISLTYLTTIIDHFHSTNPGSDLMIALVTNKIFDFFFYPQDSSWFATRILVRKLR